MEVTAPVAAPAREAATPAAREAGGFADVLERTLSSRAGRRVEHVTLGQMLRSQGATATARTATFRPAVAPRGLPATGVPPTSAPSSGAGFVDPVPGGTVTSRFGMRTHPITGQHRMHNGLDIAAPTGTPVRAVRAGTVVSAGSAGGYGLLVTVDHGNGLTSRYAHQARIDVEVGQQIAAGQTLGTVGSTGLSTGPHLHLEIRRDGEPVAPAPLLGR